MQLHALLTLIDSLILVERLSSSNLESGFGRLYRFHQGEGNLQPVPTVLGNTQDAYMNSIPGPAQIVVNAPSLVDTAMTQLDNTGYRQTLTSVI